MIVEHEVAVKGRVEPGFEAVRETFAANFSRTDAFREIGAAVAAFHRGRCVVNLWGGHADRAGTRPWSEGSLVNVWSATKGPTAIAVARLVSGGALRYEDRVAALWPEFAQNGKSDVTVEQVMSHQAGLPGFAEPTTIEDQYDWDECCAKLARQAPAWKPGTATSYHAMSFGWLAGEIVRRATGRTLGAFLREELTGPLAADVHVGLPAQLEPSVVEIVGPRASPPQGEPLPDAAMMALVNPSQDPEAPNRRAWRAAEIPAANGQASALGLARLYAALCCASGLEGVTVLPAQGLADLTRRATNDGRKDMLMGFEDSWGRGVMLNPAAIYGPGPRAFGHSGWGGAFGCADPDLELSIGYVCNQMGSALVIDPRSVALSAAITSCAARA